MEHVDVDEIESEAAGSGDVAMRGLTDPLGTSDLAMNHYTLAPGEAFSGGLHTHMDQEEVFYVLSGTATFETKPEATAESETVEVGEGQAVRFAPGEFQQGRNESDGTVTALALGAPKGSTDVRVPLSCRNCGESDAFSYVTTDDGAVLRCPECGLELEPRA